MVEATSNFDGISTLAVDLVGTLIRKPTPHFYRAASEFLSHPDAQVSVDLFRRIFRRRYWEHSMGNYETDHEFYSALLADLSRTYDPSLEVLTDLYVQASPAFSDALQFLESMSQRYRLVLASNYVEQWVVHILESNGWRSYFSGCLVSSTCRFRKPSRQFFRELLKIADAFPSEVLMIGDSLVNDVIGARASGLRSVLLDRDETTPEHTDKDSLRFSSLNELAQSLAPERTVSLRS